MTSQNDMDEAEVLLQIMMDRVEALATQNAALTHQLCAQRPKPKSQPQTPPPPEWPMAAQTRPVIRTMRAAKHAVLVASMAGVPEPPDTLGQAVQWKRDHGL